MAAGMAANKPTAVAIRASEMPGATALRLVEPIWPRSWKARMMPITVPIRPINGVTEAAGASQFMLRSSLVRLLMMPVHRAQLLQGPYDAHHGAHQSDKWGDGGGGGQPVHVALQLGQFFADAQLQGPLQRRPVGDAAAGLDLALQFLVPDR